ncbi:uncharacterized protein [Argopecten irradians]|uniref:uncharacterized protein n=1 Tax=Argopecten irradians TaxID=31199 RepID=UPI00371E1F42
MCQLSRPLGPLETMYHLYHQRGMDLIVQLMSLKTSTPVTQLVIRQALVFLMRKHPILRMCIKRTNCRGYIGYHFQEMDKCAMDLRVTENTNHEEILAEALCLTFDYEHGPLWRIICVESDVGQVNTMLSPCPQLRHSFVFAFSCHHAIADGIYLQKIYTDFIEIIHLIQKEHFCTLSAMKKSMFLPPIENILPVIFPDSEGEQRYKPRRNSGLLMPTGTKTNVLAKRGKHIGALDAYSNIYASEIVSLNKTHRQSTGVIRFKFTEGYSRTFLLNTKEKHGTVTASCVTAACLSLARLLEPGIPSNVDHLIVPVEIMVNLRRYVTDKTMFEDYPGCAAIHIPVTIAVPLRRPCNRSSAMNFWNLSQQCSDKISYIVSSGKPVEIMKEEAANEMNQQAVKGKSPFVICLTNLSRVDDMVKPELKENFKLTSFPSLTRIAVDDMPIFFINVFTMSKELNVNIGYCSSYTSKLTAARYAWLYSDTICQHSRL